MAKLREDITPEFLNKKTKIFEGIKEKVMKINGEILNEMEEIELFDRSPAMEYWNECMKETLERELELLESISSLFRIGADALEIEKDNLIK